jgi:hypothetical protein
MGLKTGEVLHPVQMMDMVTGYKPDSEHLLALLCVPSACKETNYLDNTTVREVLAPGLGDSIKVLQLFPILYNTEGSIDQNKMMKLCKNSNFCLVTNFVQLVIIELEIRKLVGLSTVIRRRSLRL